MKGLIKHSKEEILMIAENWEALQNRYRHLFYGIAICAGETGSIRLEGQREKNSENVFIFRGSCKVCR